MASISNWARLSRMEHGGRDMYPANNNNNNNDIYQANNNNDEHSASDEKSGEEETKILQKQKKDLLHRHIEKRRRDRINKSLTQLRDLIPAAKGMIKCDGNSRSGRLQKAKLLELAVEYLTVISNANNVKQEPADQSKEKTGDTVLAHSAKEIYLSGYKAGLNHALMDVSARFKLDDEELQNIITSLVSVDVKVPDILVSPNERKADLVTPRDDAHRDNDHRGGAHRDDSVSPRDDLPDITHRVPKLNDYRDAVPKLNDYRDSVPKLSVPSSPCFTESDSSGKDCKRNMNTPPNLKQYDLANQQKDGNFDLDAYTWSSRSPVSKCSSLSSRTSTDDQQEQKSISVSAAAAMAHPLLSRHYDSRPTEASPILLSTYVLDPMTSRYYPTMLPLDMVLNSCKSTPTESQQSVTRDDEHRLYTYGKRKSVIQQNSEKRQFLENSDHNLTR